MRDISNRDDALMIMAMSSSQEIDACVPTRYPQLFETMKEYCALDNPSACKFLDRMTVVELTVRLLEQANPPFAIASQT